MSNLKKKKEEKEGTKFLQVQLVVGAAAAGDHADGGTATRHRPRPPWTTRQEGVSVCPRTQVRPGAGSLCALWPVHYRCTGAARCVTSHVSAR